MKTVAFHTLGCKVNQVETEQIKEELMHIGYRVVDFNQPADLYIINTCTVTHVSDRKSRAMIRRALKTNPQATVVVTGCLAEVDAEQVARMKGVQWVIGNRDKYRIAELVDPTPSDRSSTIIREPIGRDDAIAPVLYHSWHERTRGFVKVQDGCESYCTYCIVPYTRGPVRSKDPDHVVQEVRRMVEMGYREIVLTGIHTGQYGKSMEGWSLERLVNEVLNRVPGDYRIRLSSIELGEVSDGLIELMRCEPRLCRHLHIPLQSGSDPVLKRMGRRYTGADYQRRIEYILQRIPAIGIAADVMVGFPGETDQEFDDTFRLLQAVPLLDLHVFKYSPRPGTPAASYPDQIDERLKAVRSRKLLELARHKHRALLESMKGTTLTVLVEKCQQESCSGYSDNYINVEFSSPHDLCGRLVEVVLTGVGRDRAAAILLSEWTAT